MHRTPPFSTNALVLAGVTLIVTGALNRSATATSSVPLDKPTVKVLSPADASFIMAPSGGAKLLICLEIVDGSGAGIDTNDSGLPHFVDPNKNVELFAEYVVTHGTYANGRGQTVIQVISEIPVEHLKIDDYKVTPPIDSKRIPSKFKDKAFEIPLDQAVDVADFWFQVRDRNGIISDKKADSARLFVGVGAAIYVPPPDLPAMDPEELKKESETPPRDPDTPK